MEPGTKLGPYEITEQLGAGGMGEVYLAQDTRLGRKVAIKVLPAEFASDPERLARFEQEARAAAALNHPHIAAVHDVGVEGDTHFMVQEYLEGETLREPLQKGALPLKKALGLATEIAEALAAAHAAGIIHRDLKPENIFVTKEGHAKVLDFGLAKLTEVRVTGAPGGATQSPTMMGTVAGQVMGTAGYMAPEQVEGGEVDQRTDLFAFGCVLYEMIGGRQPFAGRSLHQTLDLIVNEEPTPLVEIKPDLPAPVHWILRKGLAKDPAERYQSAADLKVDLRALLTDIQSGAGAMKEATAPPAGSGHTTLGEAAPQGWVRMTVAAMVIVALAMGLATGWFGSGRSPAPTSIVQRFRLNLPEGKHLQGGADRVVTISPDGQTLVFVAADESGYQLYRRRIGEFTATPIPGTEGGGAPFISPDGEWLAFESTMPAWIKKVPLWGSQLGTVCEQCSFGSWTEQNELLFSNLQQDLWLTPETGGERRLVASSLPEHDVGGLQRGEMLPNGDAVLFEISRGRGNVFGGIGVWSEVNNEFIRVAENGTDPFYTVSGHIVFGRDGASYAVGFDPEAFALTSDTVRVIEDVRVEGGGAVQANVSRNGTLVYASGGGATGTQLIRVDPDGSRQLVIDQWRLFRRPEVSPDGRQIAVTIRNGGESNIHIVDIEGGTLEQLTDVGNLFSTIWTGPVRIAAGFSASAEHGIQLFVTDRSAEPRTLATADAPLIPESWAAAEGRVVFHEGDLAAGDTRLREVDEAGQVVPVEGSDAGEHSATISPDGRWLAYVRQRANVREVLVRPYSDSGAPVQVSTNGGFAPRWDPNGSRLYYLTTDSRSVLMAARVVTEPRLAVTEREEMFPTHDFWNGARGTNYTVHPDGYFLFLRQAVGENSIRQINVVVNWFEELKRLVPTDGS